MSLYRYVVEFHNAKSIKGTVEWTQPEDGMFMEVLDPIADDFKQQTGVFPQEHGDFKKMVAMWSEEDGTKLTFTYGPDDEGTK